ncbi:MAG: DUF4390 domain-containing protein [Gammaproteobacteria bacterium]|nr:DUF4390 domain-containing protein [Gammaproteobacteria bacterium]
MMKKSAMKTNAHWKKLLLLFSLMTGMVILTPVFSENGETSSGSVEPDSIEKQGQTGFRVNQVATQLDEDVYRLDALLEYHLSDAAVEALVSGVPITFELQMKVVSPREWIWDKTIAELSQRYRIEYYALTRQYLVTNLNSQSQDIYSSQQGAMEALGVVTELPLIDKHLLKEGELYEGRLRTRLMIEELPTPLRVLAYLSSEWRLSSEWTVWRLQ